MAGAQTDFHNSHTPLEGPGRSAPSLLEDLLLYDPRQVVKNGYHLLEHGAKGAEQAQYIGQLLTEGSCVHEFCWKKRQSRLPALDERPGPDTIWQAAAICRRCRVHLLLKIDYSYGWQDEPCPQYENPLHHLLRSKQRTEAWTRDLTNDGNYVDEVQVFECSAPKCSAIVSIQLSTPIFTDEALHQLIDKDLISKRASAAFEQKRGQTDGMKWPVLPIDVLHDLRAYIRNAWKRDAQAQIDLHNKRFVVRFGPDGAACSDVLEMLGFRLKSGKYWIVPKPDNKEALPLSQQENVFLDNVEAELDVLVAARPQEERDTIQDNTLLEPAMVAMSRVLSCQSYDLDPTSRTRKKPLWQRSRAFTLLGIPEVASDELVIWAYQRQIALQEHVPKQTARLMTALEEIQQSRQSEILSNQVAIERSLGRFAERTVADAYRSLGLYENPSLDDNFIIGTFSSRVADAPAQEQEMRQSLLALGEYRKSKKLMDFARKTISSYEDALTFLGAEAKTDDSFLSSMFTDKASNSASDREMAEKALQIIAEYRKSASLQSFIASGYEGEITQSTMDIGEAFSLLDVEDRTLQDDALYVVYEMRLGDEPTSNHARLRKAIETIAEEKNSDFLKEKLNMPIGPQARPTQHLVTEPIGLDNIGNTCYLNSLLQWLFTIVSVRKIVLDYDQYRQIADEIHTKIKRVGHREVKPKEVENAQKFVEQLAELFQQMIVSPYRTIRPTQELARRTLEIQDATARRSSTLVQSPRRGTLGTIDGRQVFGPLPPPVEMIESQQPLQSPSEMEAPGFDKMATSVSHPEDGTAGGQQTTVPHDQAVDNMSEITLFSIDGKTASGDVEMTDNTSKGKGSSLTEDSLVIVSIEGTDESRLSSNTDKEDQPHPTDPNPSSGKQSNIVETAMSNGQDQPQSKTVSSAPGTRGDATMTDVEDKTLPRTIPPEPPSRENAGNPDQKALTKYLPPPGPPPPVPPRKPAANGVSTSTLEQYARQQDVTEVLEYVIHQLSCAVRAKGVGRNGEQQDEIHDTFHGENQEHKVEKNDTVTHREPEQFLFHQTQISNEPPDLYAALDNYFDLEDRGTIKVYNTIAKLPPVLCLALGRAVHDYKTGQNIKINCHVEIPNTLFMDRYLDAPPDSSLAVRRQQKWEYKEELGRLRNRINQLEPQGKEPVDEALSAAVAAVQHLTEIAATEDIQSLNMPPEMIADMAELSRKTRQERVDIKSRINVLEQQMNDLFTDAAFRKEEYKLHAAFFHRGSAGSGHYWIYIFDHINEIWRKYNDDIVTQVSNLQEIFGDPRDQGNPFYCSIPNANPPNPYFLVYVRSDHLEFTENEEPIVETVKREPMPVPEESLTPNHATNGTSVLPNYADAHLRPLGSDSPTYDLANATHHEWAGSASQQSQMSYMPPSDVPMTRLDGQEPGQGQTPGQFANIESVMHGQASGQGTNGAPDEYDWETKQPIEQSLKGRKPGKIGDWDDTENTSVPENVW